MMYIHFEHQDGHVLSFTMPTFEEALDAIGNEVAAILENGLAEDNVGVFPIHFVIRDSERSRAIGTAFEDGTVRYHLTDGPDLAELGFDVTPDELIPPDDD